ncbi:transposase, partial [bacterium]|nr:transposase [bacterium]
QKELFNWEEIENYSDLERLKLVIENIPDEKLMVKLEKHRGKGRNDFPVRAMWNSVLAGVVYQHISVESLIRELNRNPSLAQMCGFDIFKRAKGIPNPCNYTHFFKNLNMFRISVKEVFENLVSLLSEELPDLGKNLGVDSKAVNSLAKRKNKNQKRDGRRDIDADYGNKVYKGVHKDGKPWKTEKPWFGYKLHLIADVDYELPVGFYVTKASAADTKNLLPLVKEFNDKHNEIVERSETMTADKGYDACSTILELKSLYGIDAIIDIRNCWNKIEQEKLLNPEIADNITYDYSGNVYCYCYESETRRKMAFAGYEKKRDTLKFRCPADEYGSICKSKKTCCGKNKTRSVRIPLSTDPRIFLPIARNSYKFKKMYSKRTAVERINSRLDESFGFEKHYVRGLKKMEVTFSIALIVMLGMAYGRIKQKKPELMRSLVKAA